MDVRAHVGESVHHRCCTFQCIRITAVCPQWLIEQAGRNPGYLGHEHDSVHRHKVNTHKIYTLWKTRVDVFRGSVHDDCVYTHTNTCLCIPERRWAVAGTPKLSLGLPLQKATRTYKNFNYVHRHSTHLFSSFTHGRSILQEAMHTHTNIHGVPQTCFRHRKLLKMQVVAICRENSTYWHIYPLTQSDEHVERRYKADPAVCTHFTLTDSARGSNNRCETQ